MIAIKKSYLVGSTKSLKRFKQGIYRKVCILDITGNSMSKEIRRTVQILQAKND